MKTKNTYTVFSIIKNENDREIEKILTERIYNLRNTNGVLRINKLQ